MGAEKNPVGWFEIPVADMARAKAFYEHLLGLELEEHAIGPDRMAWFPAAPDATGAAGALVLGGGRNPSPAGVLVYFTAPDLDAALARAEEKGGATLLGRTGIGEFGFYGLVRDSEGNRIGLHSRT